MRRATWEAHSAFAARSGPKPWRNEHGDVCCCFLIDASIAMNQPQQLRRWHIYSDADALERSVTAAILNAARNAVAARRAFHLVLAGGSTPHRIYRALGQSDGDWTDWHIYFGDERCLAPDHAERNSRMATTAWLNRVDIPPAHIHPIPAELGATTAAAAYAATIAGIGEFDLVLLGLGEDGHTASLFPGHTLGSSTDAPSVLAVTDAPKPPPERVSLSARRLAATRQALFLVSGTAKRDAVAAWQAGHAIPAAAVTPAAGVDIHLDFPLPNG